MVRGKNQITFDRTDPHMLRSGPKSPIATERRPKSPSRPKATSPSRAKAVSPSRIKSPPTAKNESKSLPPASSTPKLTSPKARSPIRKSPARKSPTRGVVKPEVKKIEKKTESRKLTRSRVDIDTDSDSADIISITKPQATVRGRARYFDDDDVKIDPEPREVVAEVRLSNINVIKRVTRNSQTRDVERVIQVPHYESAKKLGEFSDDEVKERRSIENPTLGLATEFGGWFGTLLLTISFPLFNLWLLAFCNELDCSFSKIPDLKKYTLLSTYFHLKSALGVLSFATALAFLSILPFGGRKVQGLPTKQGRFLYTMNGLFSLAVFIAIGVALELRGIEICNFIVVHLFHIIVASYLLGVFIAIYVYIRSFYVPFSSLNVQVSNSNFIYGFFMGRELNPRIFSLLDLKMYVFRYSLIASVLLILAIVYRSVGKLNSLDVESLRVHPTLLVLSMCQIIYLADALLSEPCWVTSFEIQYEGFGYMSSAGYLTYPIMIAAITKYVFDHNVNLPQWQLSILSLVFMFGFILFRGSNNQKDAFRKNPYDPALSHLETIPTSKGKKLLCSSFWGIVRHPNYLGDILMNLTFGFFAPTTPAVIPFVSIVILLIHRSVRDNARCKIKYGSAWDRYCNKVKYVLVPKVY